MNCEEHNIFWKNRIKKAFIVKFIFVSAFVLILFFVNRMKLVVTAEKERLEEGELPIERARIDRRKEREKREVSGKKKGKKKKKKEKKEKKEKDILIIGDSLAYGMSLNSAYSGVSQKDDFFWLTEGGVGINFIPDNLKIETGKIMPGAVKNTFTDSRKIDLVKEVREKKIKHIAVLLGINGASSEKNATETVKRLEKIREKTGCEVYYIGAFPVVDAKAVQYGYTVRNKTVQKFNQWVVDGMKDTEIEYVDSYEEVTENTEYTKNTGDGVHYNRKIYDKVIDLLLDKIKSREGKKKEEDKKEEDWSSLGKMYRNEME